MKTGLFGNACSQGVTEIGTDDFATDRLARLENALANAFEDQLLSNLVTVRSYRLFVNEAAEIDAVSAGDPTGVAGAFGTGESGHHAIGTSLRKAKCSQEKTSQGGWFDRSKLTNYYPPHTAAVSYTHLTLPTICSV